MAAGFEYFTSTDVGAPVLTAAAGKLAAVLDWVLNSKGGWDIAFTGTNLRAYRSQTGNRFYLRLDDTQATYSRLRAYRAMTAISTGTNQFPTNTQAANINTWGVRKGYAASGSIVQPYWGIRTNRWLVMFIECSDQATVGAAYRTPLIFGDFPSLCEADAHNTFISGLPNVDSVYYYSMNELSYDNLRPSTGYNTAPCYGSFSGTPNGAIVSPIGGIHAPFKGSADSHRAALALTDRLSIGPILFGNSDKTSGSTTGAMPRGKCPNLSMLYGPAADTAVADLPAQDLVPFSLGSRSFLPICNYTQGGSYRGDCYLLETTDTDGAL